MICTILLFLAYILYLTYPQPKQLYQLKLKGMECCNCIPDLQIFCFAILLSQSNQLFYSYILSILFYFYIFDFFRLENYESNIYLHPRSRP